MSRLAITTAVCVFILGCGGEATAPAPPTSPPAAPTAPPAPIAPPPIAPPASSPSLDPPAAPPIAGGATPESVYEAMRADYNRGDDLAYFGAMGESFVCYFGRADVPRTEVETSRRPLLLTVREARESESPPRIVSMEVRRVRETADEIELVDFGWTGRGGYDASTVFHQKRLLFRRDGTTWRLVGEGPATGAACTLPALDATPPERWRRLRDAFRSFVEGCEGPAGATMEDGYPGVGGSNGCMTEMNITPAVLCRDHLDRECITQAVADLETFIMDGVFDLDSELEALEADE